MTAVVVLPTPPFWLATARIRGSGRTGRASAAGGGSGACSPSSAGTAGSSLIAAASSTRSPRPSSTVSRETLPSPRRRHVLPPRPLFRTTAADGAPRRAERTARDTPTPARAFGMRRLGRRPRGRARRGPRPATDRPARGVVRVTARMPPTRRNGAPHSAVVAGGPKLRATTRSHVPRQRSSLPATSAGSATTVAVRSRPSRPTARRKKSARVALDSTNTHETSGSSIASGRPSAPPPLPRSTATVPGDSSARPVAASCTWASMGPGPRKPRACASSSSAVTSDVVVVLNQQSRVRSQPGAGVPRPRTA